MDVVNLPHSTMYAEGISTIILTFWLIGRILWNSKGGVSGTFSEPTSRDGGSLRCRAIPAWFCGRPAAAVTHILLHH